MPENAHAKSALGRRILELSEAQGLSMRALSLAAGLDETFVYKLVNRKDNASVRAENLERLATALDTPPEQLLRFVPKTASQSAMGRLPPLAGKRATNDLPILGVANGSAVGAFVLSNDPIAYIARPPALETVKEAYAVYVRNESMAPMHGAGDLRFVHPHRPPRSGDSVIVQVKDASDSLQAYIKILERTTAEWLVCRQINPPAEIKFAQNTVVAVHKVLTINEMFNA